MKLSWSGWVLILWSAVLVVCCAPGAPRLVGQVGGPSFTDALIALGTLLALGIACWVLVVAALVAAGASAGLVRLVTPRVLRSALLAGAAGALVLGPAHAERAAGPDAGIHHSVSGLPLPDRPDAAAGPRRTAHRAPAAPTARAVPARSVTVRPGDTLWAIAARSLPDGASAAQIADATRAWHAANRDVIGDDPDLIVPAQRLVPPTGKDLS
ncbi:MAG: LysM domain-containing protein [Aeromicrobium sp.]